MMFLLIIHLIRRISLSFPTLNNHFLSKRVLWVDIIRMFGMNGVGYWISFFLEGAEGTFACH